MKLFIIIYISLMFIAVAIEDTYPLVCYTIMTVCSVIAILVVLKNNYKPDEQDYETPC